MYTPLFLWGAFYTLAKLPVDDSDKFCEWYLKDFRHNGATIMLALGIGFYSDEKLGKQLVRIAFSLPKEELQTSLEILKEALKAYNNERNKI